MTFELLAILAWGGLCQVWAALLYAQHVALRSGVMISPQDVGTGEPPDVTVLIPACNEAGAIAACLDSVLAQVGAVPSIVVVDDRSDDQTAAIVDRYVAAHEQVRLIRIASLAKGWLGKSHALWQGTRTVDTDWLLFLDADCRLEPGAVAAAVAEAVRRNAGLLTLWPRHAAGGFWEAMLIPLCGAIMALWYGRSNGSGAESRGPGFANGQFLLMRRALYEQIDGHRSVRRAVIEDVPLAEAARRAGVRTWAGGGRDLVSVRMYDSLGAICRGWSRIFVGALRRPWKVVASMAWLAVGSLLPFIVAPLLIRDMLADPTPAAVSLVALCATHLALLAIVSVRFWALGGCDRRTLWLYPLSVVVVMAILADALWCLTVRRRIGWRTTSYRFDRTVSIVDER